MSGRASLGGLLVLGGVTTCTALSLQAVLLTSTTTLFSRLTSKDAVLSREV